MNRRIRWVPATLALTAVLAGSFLLTASAQAPDDGFGPPVPPRVNGPKIVILDSKFHWGKVLQGEKIEHVFRVQNQGTAPLRITNVKPG